MDAENYINDLEFIILDKLDTLLVELTNAKPEDEDYIKGQIMSLYDLADIMISQADIFDVNLKRMVHIDLSKYIKKYKL